MPTGNDCVLIGHLGQDPTLRYTPNGTAVCTFSIAENYGKKDNRQTQWHRVIVWGDLAELAAKTFKKGDAVQVEGAYRSREWTDKNGKTQKVWELTAYRISKPIYQKRTNTTQTEEPADDLSDIPF